MENPILLWDYLADFVLTSSLKMPATKKLYFGNLYDEKQIEVNVEELEEVLSEMLESMLSEVEQSNLVLEYSFDQEEKLTIKLTQRNGKSSSF